MSTSKTEILEERPKLIKTERQEIRPILAEFDEWLEEKDWLTVHEKALLEARLAAYANDLDAHGKKLRIEFKPR